MNELLLLVESIIFLAGTVLLFRRERLFGIYFLALYIYTIFSQIGYLYVPELSAQLFAYFGEAVWRRTALFIVLSATTLFLVLRFGAEYIMRPVAALMEHVSVESCPASEWQRGIRLAVAVSLVLQTAIFCVSFRDISWESAQQEDVFSATFLVGVFVLLVKLSVGVNLALYCTLRQRAKGMRSSRDKLGLATAIVLFILFTFKLGNRTDQLALFLGCVVFELSQIRLRVRHVAYTALAGCVVLIYLNFLEANRYAESPTDVDFVTKLLVKDYFAPAHVLFAAVAFEVVDPVTVAVSDVGNSLMFLKRPYLQAPVMDLFFPGGATRNASYGFYSLTEGYMFAGFAGFLYNGLVLGCLLSVWRGLASTSSVRLNMFLLAIMGSMLVNLVRGQASYYIKYLYSFVLPGTLVYLAFSTQRLEWKRTGLRTI